MRRLAGFTLIELSIVVLILGLLGAAVLRYASTQADANNIAAANATLDVVETALMNYRMANNRLPCPTDLTAAENTAAFGVELGSPGDGWCGAGGTLNPMTSVYTESPPGAFWNTTTDPDNPTGGTDPYASNEKTTPSSAAAFFDLQSPDQVIAGGIPTKTLNIDDKYAYDPWGRKILYAVDSRTTYGNAFTYYTVGNQRIGAIAIKNTTTDNTGCAVGTATPASQSCLSLAVTLNAIYALVSFGEDGHGGYVRNINSNQTSTPYNAGASNPDELANCSCNSSAVATPFNRIFVQNPKIPSNLPGYTFDDIVRFKTRSQMYTPAETQR